MTHTTPPPAFGTHPTGTPNPTGPPPGWDNMGTMPADQVPRWPDEPAATPDTAEGEQPAVSYADTVRREIVGDDADTAPPAGAELLRDPLDLTWDERADVVAAVDDLAPVMEQLRDAQQQRAKLTDVFDKPSDAIRLIARMVRVLTPLAHDADAFTDWTKHATQQQISDLYGYVQSHMGLGEN